MLGEFEEKEDKVRPPQTLLSSNWIRGAVAVRTKGQGESPPPTMITQSHVVEHTPFFGFASIYMIEQMGSTPSAVV